MKQRIVLMPACMEDVDLIVDVKSDTSLWIFEDDVPTDKNALRKSVISRIESDWYKQYIIKLNTTQAPTIGLFHVHWYIMERRSWEIGYCIFPEYRGKGYCVEAAKMVLKYTFEELNAHKVVAMCNQYNIASYKVIEKLGMRREGVFKEELPWQNKWADQFFYCILATEYQKINALNKQI